MKSKFLIIALMVLISGGIQQVNAHCEVPCGIYDDELRIALIKEHIQTITKAMKSIDAISKEDDENYNQMIRWTITKEEHANEIQHIVSQYFMTQRIKSAEDDPANAEKNMKMLAILHKMLILAMKCKQTIDPAWAEKLLAETEAFEKLYFEGKEHHHH